MTLNFQKNILRYLFQYKTSHWEVLSDELFDLVPDKAIFGILKSYILKYKNLPEKENFIQYITDLNQLTDEAINLLKNQLEECLEPVSDIVMIEEKLLIEVKKKLFTKVLTEGLKMASEGVTVEDIETIHKKISGITSMRDQELDPGFYALKNLNRPMKQSGTVYPTYLRGLNALTAVGGFHPPQTIIWLGGPKTFKTGFLIKFAVEYMKDGLDVFYADFENGKEAIHQRVKQCLLECKVGELKLFDSELNQIKDKLLDLTGSGDIFIQKYNKRLDHFAHIDKDIDRLMNEGFNPKFLVADYVDIMGPPERGMDKRIGIQANYAAGDTMMNKYNMFMFTVSKIKASAFGKDNYTPEDVAEDVEKVYNSHASFSIVRRPEDIDEGLAKISAMVQRQGASFSGEVLIDLDPDSFKIIEL